MSINPDKLNEIFETLKNDLGEGFIATDVWSTLDAKSLLKDHRYNKNPEAISLFQEVTHALDKTLKVSGFPEFGNYYMVNLANNHLAMVIAAGTFQQFLLVNLSKTTMGILMSIALPNLLKGLAAADITGEQPESKKADPQRRSALLGFWNALSKTISSADFHLLTRPKDE